MRWFQLSDSTLSDNELLKAFEKYSQGDENLRGIFLAALKNRHNFPKKQIASDLPREEAYLKRWCSDYLDFIVPSNRVGIRKMSPDDPALMTLIENYMGLTSNEAADSLKQHNLWMEAENIQGELLEEYIASKVTPLGWVWCKGAILRATDFINAAGTVYLQIKNKYNTENSSSSAIRNGSTIKKWFRLGVRIVGGQPVPIYKWHELNQIIDSGSNINKRSDMCEEEYQEFLKKALKNNPNLLG